MSYFNVSIYNTLGFKCFLRPFVKDARTVYNNNVLTRFLSLFLILVLPFQAQFESYLLPGTCVVKPQTTVMFLVITPIIDYLLCVSHCTNMLQLPLFILK